jgi:hypothetical protein
MKTKKIKYLKKKYLSLKGGSGSGPGSTKKARKGPSPEQKKYTNDLENSYNDIVSSVFPDTTKDHAFHAIKNCFKTPLVKPLVTPPVINLDSTDINLNNEEEETIINANLAYLLTLEIIGDNTTVTVPPNPSTFDKTKININILKYITEISSLFSLLKKDDKKYLQDILKKQDPTDPLKKLPIDDKEIGDLQTILPDLSGLESVEKAVKDANCKSSRDQPCVDNAKKKLKTDIRKKIEEIENIINDYLDVPKKLLVENIFPKSLVVPTVEECDFYDIIIKLAESSTPVLANMLDSYLTLLYDILDITPPITLSIPPPTLPPTPDIFSSNINNEFYQLCKYLPIISSDDLYKFFRKIIEMIGIKFGKKIHSMSALYAKVSRGISRYFNKPTVNIGKSESIITEINKHTPPSSLKEPMYLVYDNYNGKPRFNFVSTIPTPAPPITLPLISGNDIPKPLHGIKIDSEEASLFLLAILHGCDSIKDSEEGRDSAIFDKTTRLGLGGKFFTNYILNIFVAPYYDKLIQTYPTYPTPPPNLTSMDAATAISSGIYPDIYPNLDFDISIDNAIQFAKKIEDDCKRNNCINMSHIEFINYLSKSSPTQGIQDFTLDCGTSPATIYPLFHKPNDLYTLYKWLDPASGGDCIEIDTEKVEMDTNFIHKIGLGNGEIISQGNDIEKYIVGQYVEPPSTTTKYGINYEKKPTPPKSEARLFIEKNLLIDKKKKITNNGDESLETYFPQIRSILNSVSPLQPADLKKAGKLLKNMLDIFVGKINTPSIPTLDKAKKDLDREIKVNVGTESKIIFQFDLETICRLGNTEKNKLLAVSDTEYTRNQKKMLLYAKECGDTLQPAYLNRRYKENDLFNKQITVFTCDDGTSASCIMLSVPCVVVNQIFGYTYFIGNKNDTLMSIKNDTLMSGGMSSTRGVKRPIHSVNSYGNEESVNNHGNEESVNNHGTQNVLQRQSSIISPDFIGDQENFKKIIDELAMNITNNVIDDNRITALITEAVLSEFQLISIITEKSISEISEYKILLEAELLAYIYLKYLESRGVVDFVNIAMINIKYMENNKQKILFGDGRILTIRHINFNFCYLFLFIHFISAKDRKDRSDRIEMYNYTQTELLDKYDSDYAHDYATDYMDPTSELKKNVSELYETLKKEELEKSIKVFDSNEEFYHKIDEEENGPLMIDETGMSPAGSTEIMIEDIKSKLIAADIPKPIAEMYASSLLVDKIDTGEFIKVSKSESLSEMGPEYTYIYIKLKEYGCVSPEEILDFVRRTYFNTHEYDIFQASLIITIFLFLFIHGFKNFFTEEPFYKIITDLGDSYMHRAVELFTGILGQSNNYNISIDIDVVVKQSMHVGEHDTLGGGNTSEEESLSYYSFDDNIRLFINTYIGVTLSKEFVEKKNQDQELERTAQVSVFGQSENNVNPTQNLNPKYVRNNTWMQGAEEIEHPEPAAMQDTNPPYPAMASKKTWPVQRPSNPSNQSNPSEKHFRQLIQDYRRAEEPASMSMINEGDLGISRGGKRKTYIRKNSIKIKRITKKKYHKKNLSRRS